MMDFILFILKIKEFVWSTRLQPDGEASLDQSETEASQSPTGTLQSISPTWEFLQVIYFTLCSFNFCLYAKYLL